MSYRFHLCLSHDAADQTVAASVRQFLESVFMNARVSLSGSDLELGPYQRARQAQLRGAAVVISLLSRRAVRNARLHFEAGAGFLEGKGCLLLCDGLRREDLRAPMSSLPQTQLDEAGLRDIVTLISTTVGMPCPREVQGCDELLRTVQSFLSLRDSETGSVDLPAANGAQRPHREPLDATIHSWHRRVKEQIRMVTIKSLGRAPRSYELPGREELKSCTIAQLFDLAVRHNLPAPTEELVAMMTFETDIPVETAPRWKKMNAFRMLEGIDEGLRRFEKML